MAHDAHGTFIGYGVGDDSLECQRVNHRLLLAYATHSNAKAHGVVEGTLFTQGTADALIDLCTFMNRDANSQAAAIVRGAHMPLRTDGIADLNTRKAIGAYVLPPPPEPVCVFFSVNGAGSTWDMGYPYDIGETLDKSKCWHQPIGYDTSPFPMMKGVKTGVIEFIRQLYLPRGSRGLNCTQLPWHFSIYSMGAIVGMTVLMRVLHGDLQQFKPTFMGGSTFGNPMREHGHTFPGCSYSDGEGIVLPGGIGTPEAVWEFAADKEMTGSPGDDLYTKIGKAGATGPQDVDMRDVWDIVATGNPLHLAEAIATLLLKPSFTGGYGAARAAFQALDFFVAKGLTPHTSYQFTLPIDGDPRDCWELARGHAADLVARLPVGAAA